MYDYKDEPRKVIFMIDSKSFYASVESNERGLNPLQSILVVMSKAANTGNGLVLAASPMVKKLFGISNVTRASAVPPDKRITIAEPRMNLYIQKNLEVHEIFSSFASEADIHPYSIDESIIDMTHSWKLFGNTPFEVAHKIQLAVREQMGFYLTVGVGDNPLMAKLALDLEAKKAHSLFAEWHYEEIPDKLWPVTDFSDVWSIGRQTATKLKAKGINSMYDLAHLNPYDLKEEFGIMGEQLFATSWGVDRSDISKKVKPKSKSYGNSQVLPKNYSDQDQIELVIKELTEQVAARLRAHHVTTGVIHLGVGYSYKERQKGNGGFGHSMKIIPTNLNKELKEYAVSLFREKWSGVEIRFLSIDCGKLADDSIVQLDLFDPENKKLKQRKLDYATDKVRKEYGFSSLVKLSSKKEGATAIDRAGLVGGHAGGNAYE